MISRTKFTPGLSETNCIGPSGGYRAGAIADRVDLASCYRDGDAFCSVDPSRSGLFAVNAGQSFNRSVLQADWTGKTLGYQWAQDGVDVEARTALPGPIFLPHGKTVPLRMLTEVHWIVNLETDEEGYLGRVPDVQGSRFYLFKGRTRSVLVVASQPLKLEVVSHSFWALHFPRKGGRLMLVPLLDPAEAPSSEAQFDLWQEILRRPPLLCRESYCIEDDKLILQQEFPGSTIAPVPPLLTHLDSSSLMQLPAGRKTLMTAALGPYQYVKASNWQAEIQLDWTRATLSPSREVSGRLAPVPEELSYAGDVTYSEDDPMDQLLNLRIWAPLLEVAPQRQKEQLLQRLKVPSAKAYQDSLEIVTEPVTGRKWAKEDQIFDLWGDVSYDPDWYNGLSLSGLQRACRCGEESIAAAARRTARKLQATREQLVAFYELFHCWSYSAALSDPQATFWNSDCSHNGLEGLLAEAKMRRDEGNVDGADRMLYLAGKTAAGLLALQYAVDHCRRIGYTARDDGGEAFGCDGLVPGRGVTVTTAGTKAPYNLVNNFPEYVALLKLHGPVDVLRRQVSAWEKQFPGRYKHWVQYYIGPEEAQRLEKMLQENRVQSAVFYHLSPEIWLRRFVLEQDPETIEEKFNPRINLAEQLLLRSAMELAL